MKNSIYVFSGTGNSLQVAKTIASIIGDCELIAIAKDTSFKIPEGSERIGFVFPNYAGGPPQMVANFINNIEFPENATPYLFAVITYGGHSGSVLGRTENLLKGQGASLNYGASIRAFPNLVTSYPMIKGRGFFSKMLNRKSYRVGKEILGFKQKTITKSVNSKPSIYEKYMLRINDSDQNFYVNDTCISCGVCSEICPAKNITMNEGKPKFHHKCESCMACIQFCPKRAINDKGKTEKRGRYTNPDITAQMLIELRGKTIS